ncbi:MAG: FkbM family methyltransferase [Hasllibacter sp.]
MDDDDAPLETIYGRFGRGSQKRLELTYDYEHGTLRAFSAMAKRIRAARILDIGANIGVYAVHLSRLERVAALHCFEPAPAAFAELARNAALQDGPERFSLHPVALSDRAGRAELAVYGEMAGNNALMGTRGTRRKAPPGTVSVDCAPLDALLDARGEAFAAKIDVEGHELKVIEGARGYLAGNRGVLQVECFGRRIAPLREALEGLGYHAIGRMKDDWFFANRNRTETRALRDIAWEATAAELKQLMELRRAGRRAGAGRGRAPLLPG